VQSRDQRLEVILGEVLYLVEQEDDAPTGLLRHLAQGHDQVGQVLDRLPAVGKALGCVDDEAGGEREPFDDTVTVNDLRTPAARRARSFHLAFGASWSSARRAS